MVGADKQKSNRLGCWIATIMLGRWGIGSKMDHSLDQRGLWSILRGNYMYTVLIYGPPIAQPGASI